MKKLVHKFYGVIIECLMILGLGISLKYLELIETRGDCGCIIGRDLYMQYIINYSKLFGVRGIDISVVGFLIGSLIGLLAILNIRVIKQLLSVVIIIVDASIIPYYIYIEVSLGFICLYCLILQFVSIFAGLISLVNLYLFMRQSFSFNLK